MLEVLPAARMCLGCERLVPILEESRARFWTRRTVEELGTPVEDVDLSSLDAIMARLRAGRSAPSVDE